MLNERHGEISQMVNSNFEERDLHAKDLLKPPTLITIGSLGLVLNGCRSIDSIKGVNQIALGRAGDLIDGVVARALNQTSDAGAITDTVADKTGMLAIAEAAWRKNAIPKMVLEIIMSRQTLNAGLTIATGYRHPEASFRPTRSGKIAMAADNVAFLGYLYANALEQEYPDSNLHKAARGIARAAFITGSTLGASATTHYIKRAL